MNHISWASGTSEWLRTTKLPSREVSSHRLDTFTLRTITSRRSVPMGPAAAARVAIRSRLSTYGTPVRGCVRAYRSTRTRSSSSSFSFSFLLFFLLPAHALTHSPLLLCRRTCVRSQRVWSGRRLRRSDLQYTRAEHHHESSTPHTALLVLRASHLLRGAAWAASSGAVL